MAAQNDFRPVILVRGFDPVGDVAGTTYYGFNDGTVYPHKLGSDYIYEGMLVKFLKTRFRRVGAEGWTAYEDATNAMRYQAYRPDAPPAEADPQCLADLEENILGRPASEEEKSWLTGPVLLEPGVARRFKDVPTTLWVYRYYDFKHRNVPLYAQQLQRMIAMVEAVTGVQGVNLICHSNGGIVARYLIQKLYADRAEAERHVNKWVTLGTPHRGIVFQVLPNLDLWELQVFNRSVLESEAMFGTPLGRIDPWFDPARILCVIGTNWRSYPIHMAASLNQFASWLKGQDQNHSDGLVKQECAALAGAHRAYVFKCHGGPDSLITSREAFDLSTRFFFGDVRVTIRAQRAEIASEARQAGQDALAGRVHDQPQYYLGFSVKPRALDYFLNQQDAASENCFGPIRRHLLTAADFQYDSEDSARSGILFEGFFNSALAPDGRSDLVFRFDTFVSERDPHTMGHSDTVLVNRQSYFQLQPRPDGPADLLFYPRAVASEEALPCVYQADKAIYTLDLPFGILDTHFALSLTVQIEGLAPPERVTLG